MTLNQQGTKFFNKWFTKTIGKPLYPYQTKLLTTHAKNNIINKSRQTGISTLMAAYGLYKAMSGKKTIIISPSERQSRHVMEIITKFLQNIKHQPLIEEMKTSIRFIDGGEIRSLPNSSNTIRGLTADVIIADEMAHFLNNTDHEVIEAITPSLSRGGEFWMVSTPYGEQGTFYNTWIKNENFTKFLIKWNECPDLRIEQIQQICADPLMFAQEYDNQFLQNIETEFPLKLIHDCIDPELQYQDITQHTNLIMGIDVGRKIDQTAIIGLIKREDKYVIVYKNTMQGTEYEIQQSFIESLINTKRIQVINIDETGIGNMLAENLKKKKPYLIKAHTFTNELKEQLVINLKTLMVNQQVKFPDDAQLVQAINNIKRTQSSTGRLKFDSDRTDFTGHSDIAWALMLALYQSEKPKPVYRLF